MSKNTVVAQSQQEKLLTNLHHLHCVKDMPYQKSYPSHPLSYQILLCSELHVTTWRLWIGSAMQGADSYRTTWRLTCDSTILFFSTAMSTLFIYNMFSCYIFAVELNESILYLNHTFKIRKKSSLNLSLNKSCVTVQVETEQELLVNTSQNCIWPYCITVL